MFTQKTQDSFLDINQLVLPNITGESFFPTLISFIMCVAMSFVIRNFYINRSFSLTGKMHIGSIIPVLSAVVFLVIVVVKTSLALSLGLVGALSIVRFRTPIKEPEELVYLFLAIAVGLGYAAGQVLITTVITLLTLLMIYFWLSNLKIKKTSEYNLVVKWVDTNVMFEDVLNKITPVIHSLKLVRLDRGPNINTSVMLVIPDEKYSIDEISNNLNKLDNEIKVSFFEAKTNW
jgi:hypothetical protein